MVELVEVKLLEEVEVLVVVMALGGPLAGSNIIEETTWQVSAVVVPHGLGVHAPVGNVAAT